MAPRIHRTRAATRSPVVVRGRHAARVLPFRASASDLLARGQFADRHGYSFNVDGTPKRNLYQALGYKRVLDVEDFRDRHKRGGIAKRIIEALPRATWQGGASIVEDPDPGIETEFERAARELFERLDIWAQLMRADILAGIGRYSVLLIGAQRAGESPLEPLAKLRSPDDVLFLRPFAEDHAVIAERVKQTTDARFGLPESYTLSFEEDAMDTDQSKVHWSRCIHIAHGLLEDQVYGTPTLEAVWNLLDDADKVVGGGAEATWKNVFLGLQMDQDPTTALSAADQELLSDELDEWEHGMRRTIRTQGIKLTPLGSSVPGFGPNLKAVVELVSGTLGIPQRILLGSERGQLASGQDDENWIDRIAEHRREGAMPTTRNLIDRLIEHGALPAPSEYEIVWPSRDEMSESEKGSLASSLATANKAQKEAEGRILLTADELRDRIFALGPLEDVVESDEAAEVTLRGAADLADEDADEPEWRAIHRAADAHREPFAAAVVASWDAKVAAFDEDAFVSAIGSTGAPGAEEVALAALAASAESLRETLLPRVSEVLEEGALAALRSARARGSWFRSARFSAEFDRENARAVEWAQLRVAQLVTEIGGPSSETAEAIRALVAEGIRDGIPPRALARRVREIVGFRLDQLRAFENLEAELRSARVGSVVERFPARPGVRANAGFRAKIPPGGATDTWVAAQLKRYREMQHNYRARTIARSETLRAANYGQKELWLQAREAGQLQGEQRVWIATPDERTRPEHMARDGVVVGIDEEWPWGTEPGEEVACRCSQGIATPEDLERSGSA